MVNLPWVQNGCSACDHDHEQCTEVRSLQKSSNCQSLVKRTNKVVQNVVFVSPVVQPLTAPITFSRFKFTVQKEPRSRLSCGWDASSCVTRHPKGFVSSKLALSSSAHRKIACASFQGLLSGAVSRVALTKSPLTKQESEPVPAECPAEHVYTHAE